MSFDYVTKNWGPDMNVLLVEFATAVLGKILDGSIGTDDGMVWFREEISTAMKDGIEARSRPKLLNGCSTSSAVALFSGGVCVSYSSAVWTIGGTQPGCRGVMHA